MTYYLIDEDWNIKKTSNDLELLKDIQYELNDEFYTPVYRICSKKYYRDNSNLI